MIARAELAEAGITVSLMFPSIITTEFVTSVRAGVKDAVALSKAAGVDPQAPSEAADAILALIASRDERADLGPVA